ncbi:hypothetical protein [Anaeroselena agilis]|uniref:SGNH hydrolase-type esterase domain-containing protein n=1 Tax=Anaeroselena agilis TaxID=3063788 RepID=A0ABU3P4B2_9FIRM|nr:hypothetical protein [Selenomonadales bacterium 4137-cl]
MILFVTDSLGGPRFSPEQLYFQDTWVYKVRDHLKNMGVETHSIVCYGLDSHQVRYDLLRFLPYYKPDLIVYQIGICDCAPRAISTAELRLIKYLPGRIQSLVRRIIRRYFKKLTVVRDISNIDLFSFQENIRHISKQFNSIFIPIAPVCDGYVKVTPLIRQRAIEYNEVLKKHSQFWLDEYVNSPKELIENMFVSDHHHLNNFGQEYLTKLILNNPYLMGRLTKNEGLKACAFEK